MPKRSVRSTWISIFKGALEFDEWGQVQEAVDKYEKLNQKIASDLDELEKACLSPADWEALHNLQIVLKMRIACIGDLDANGVTFAKIKQLLPWLDTLFEKKGKFPFEIPQTSSEYTILEEVGGAKDESEEFEEDSTSQPSLPRSPSTKRGTSVLAKSMKPGSTSIQIHIDKIGLKDAQSYIEPRLTVSVVDYYGKVIDSYDTNVTNKMKATDVVFSENVNLKTTVEELTTDGNCLFFEFKHFKPKKKKISTRCFTFMEHEEVQRAQNQSNVCLELYKKPTDFTRKRLSLHSSKKLYLHLSFSFFSNP